MGERENKINTLEESLRIFNKPFLLEQLDINLELVRRNKETKEQHVLLLKSVDKNLLKLSQIYHPDKAIGQNKSKEEVARAQNMQTALNSIRTVLKALSQVFLKDIDVYFKYEFFAKLDINTLINEKQIELEINNVLCKISHLSEIKRVNIIGGVRNFLLKCRNCLESFRLDNKQDFNRNRNYAFRHLQKCIEGYEMLFVECNLIIEECSAEEDENTKKVIQKMYEQSLEESKILRDLQTVAKRSLGGSFTIFPIYKPRHDDPMAYVPVVPLRLEYFVSPFLFYVDILLMCSVMVEKKSLAQEFGNRTGGFWEYFKRSEPEKSIFFSEPAILKAYYLASYFNNKNHHKNEVQAILRQKNNFISESSRIQETFKEIVTEVEEYLATEFDIDSYKEGKSNREQFIEKLSVLKDSMSEYEVLRKNVEEKIKLYEQETSEIRMNYRELSRDVTMGEQTIKATNPLYESDSCIGNAKQYSEMELD